MTTDGRAVRLSDAVWAQLLLRIYRTWLARAPIVLRLCLRVPKSDRMIYFAPDSTLRTPVWNLYRPERAGGPVRSFQGRLFYEPEPDLSAAADRLFGQLADHTANLVLPRFAGFPRPDRHLRVDGLGR